MSDNVLDSAEYMALKAQIAALEARAATAPVPATIAVREPDGSVTEYNEAQFALYEEDHGGTLIFREPNGVEHRIAVSLWPAYAKRFGF
jgi:hypothetical protein